MIIFWIEAIDPAYIQYFESVAQKIVSVKLQIVNTILLCKYKVKSLWKLISIKDSRLYIKKVVLKRQNVTGKDWLVAEVYCEDKLLT